jgi:hypothetical protein
MQFIINILSKILDRILDIIFGKNPDQSFAVENRGIDKKRYYKAGIFGGVACGLIGSLTILYMKLSASPPSPPPSGSTVEVTGYAAMKVQDFLEQIFPVLLLLQTITGAILGYLCSRFSWQRKKLSILQGLFLFVSAFLILTLFRQAMARDALRPFGTWPIYSENGEFIRWGGGILGEPDFETIATGAFAAVGFLLLVVSLRKLKCKVPNLKSAFAILYLTTIGGAVAWTLVFLVYKVCLNFEWVQYGKVLIRSDIFIIDFPHPERPILAMVLNFLFILALLIAIYYFSEVKKPSSRNRGKAPSRELVY